MAKYAADVNKQTKIIDVQKQFPGGLKTVDTDDALGKVYLRETDNLSLSEYSFLEKRHGQYIEHQIQFEEDPVFFSDPPFVQGYFEYVRQDRNIDRLLFVEGKAYLKTYNSDFYKEITEFSTEDDETLTYPDPQIFTEVIDTILLDIVDEASVIGKPEVSYTFKYFENYESSEAVSGVATASASFTLVETPELSISSNGIASLNTNFIKFENIKTSVSSGITANLNTNFIKFENPKITDTTNFKAVATAEFIKGVNI